jgi:hypothetical protein
MVIFRNWQYFKVIVPSSTFKTRQVYCRIVSQQCFCMLLSGSQAEWRERNRQASANPTSKRIGLPCLHSQQPVQPILFLQLPSEGSCTSTQCPKAFAELSYRLLAIFEYAWLAPWLLLFCCCCLRLDVCFVNLPMACGVAWHLSCVGFWLKSLDEFSATASAYRTLYDKETL